MANFNQQVIYKLRDLGYYGDFNERDVARICEAQPKMRLFFDFIKDELSPDEHLITEYELD